jgi:CRISPR/Cas system CMR-associated protein Cmr3 (group 5 of RAMP superfamily)
VPVIFIIHFFYLNPDEFQHFVKRNDLCLFHAPIKISKVENTVLRTIARIENHKKRGIITVGKVWDFYGKQFLENSLNYKQEIFAKN